MSKKVKRFRERAFWWSGIAFLLGSVEALFLSSPADIVVSLGGIGLLFCVISLALEIRRKGLTADSAFALSSCLALSCGVPGYFFQHMDWVLISAYAGFLFFFFIGIGAQVRGQWGNTKNLWQSRKDRHTTNQASDPLN